MGSNKSRGATFDTAASSTGSTPKVPKVNSPAIPHLSIQVINFANESPGDWQHLSTHAVAADNAGVDRLAVSDHVAFGEDLSAYADPAAGGTPGGQQPTGPDGAWLEPLTTLTWLASRTSNIRLQTGILLAPLRRPAVLAKTAATLDVLSNGRLDLGVGIGWQAAEYEASGLEFARRGKLLDHALAVCQVLWTQQSASFTDVHLAFEGIHAMPKPVQAGGVPIWVSGTANPRTAQRLATFGCGWIPWGNDRYDLVGGIDRMRNLLNAIGYEIDDFQVQGTVPTIRSSNGEIDLIRTMTVVPDLVEAGVTDCRIAMKLPDDLEASTDFLAGVVAAFHQATGRSK